MIGRIPFILFAFFLLCCQISFGQENNRELGIRFNSFNQFSLIYKKHLRGNIYRRHRGAFGDFIMDNDFKTKSYSARFNYSVGREIRTEIKKPFYIVSGCELFMNSNFNRSAEFNEDKEIRTRLRVDVGLGLIFGFHYYFSDQLYVNLEAIPIFSKGYSYVHVNQPTNRSQTTETRIRFLVRQRELFFLTFAYRFHFKSKKKSKEKK